jgi:hypothetical protein
VRALVALAAVAIGAAAVPVALAGSTPPRKIRTGHYAWQAGSQTTDNAVFFRVTGTGSQKTISGLRFRNACLTPNQRHPPRIAIGATGHFSRSWTSTAAYHPQIKLSGRFTSPGRARGTLTITELVSTCHSTAHFRVHTPPRCSDGKDNDHDGRTDWNANPALRDPQCTSRFTDDDEAH